MKLAVLAISLLLGAGIAHADRFAAPAPVDPYAEAAPVAPFAAVPVAPFADAPPVDTFAPPRKHGKRGRLRQALVQQFDRDGDGRLRGTERKQAARALRALAHRLQTQGRQLQAQSMRERLIRRFDRDGDGNLGPGEVPPRVKMRLRKIDRNGDNWIGNDELR